MHNLALDQWPHSAASSEGAGICSGSILPSTQAGLEHSDLLPNASVVQIGMVPSMPTFCTTRILKDHVSHTLVSFSIDKITKHMYSKSESL